MIFFIKGLIRRLKYAFLNLHHKDVKRYISYFERKDFEVIRTGNAYKIIFDNSLGYYKDDYEPTFEYNFFTNHWTVKFQNVVVKTLINPCFELISEWRGYTLLKTPQEGETVIDAGAATGFISLLFAKKVGEKGIVIALEPDNKMLKILKYNIKINGVKNIKIIPKGLYNQSGTFAFDPIKFTLAHTNIASNYNIQTIDLQSIIIEFVNDSAKLSFIKIDIEGAELAIAQDLGKIILSHKNAMAVIASYHAYEGTTTGGKITELFDKEFSALKIVNNYIIHPTTYIYQNNL